MAIGLAVVMGGLLMFALGAGMQLDELIEEEGFRIDDTIGGSDDDEVIKGTNASEVILPHYGDNQVSGQGGNDTISDYPWDQDRETSPAGLVNPNWGSDQFDGGEGDDVLIASGGADQVQGGAGDDRITGVDLHAEAPFSPDVLSGGAGSDWIVADDGDTVTGGAGTDFFSVVVDTPENRAVVIEDYESGEVTDVLVFDAALLAKSQEQDSIKMRDEKEGAVLSIGGFDAVIFKNTLAADLNGFVRVLDGNTA